MGTVLKALGVLFLCLIGGCTLLAIVGGSVVNKAANEVQREMSKPPVITMAEFNQLSSGMTYQQVVAIIGAEGKVMSENTLPGFPSGQIHTIMYIWENPDFGNANVMFQNNALMSKSQFGLK